MKLSKTVTAEIGHRLLSHPGKCSRPHGHHYVFTVTVEGEIDPKTGMVMDFSQIKETIKSLVDSWDHKMIVQRGDTLVHAMGSSEYMVLEVPPTAENLARELFDFLSKSY